MYPLEGLVCFLQAEDGIRDFHVTGVQTCALPISTSAARTRPCGPEPFSCSSGTPRSRASLRTNGAARTRSRCGCRAGAAGAGLAWGAVPTMPNHSPLASPSLSMRTRSSPRCATEPAGTASEAIRPATGDVSSTAALADSTWHNGWNAATWSPGDTFHSSTSASWMPSPRSGRRNSNAIRLRVLHHLPTRANHPRRAGQVHIFEHLRRIHDVVASHPQRRAPQREEAVLHERSHQLGARPTRPRCLVDHHQPTSLVD